MSYDVVPEEVVVVVDGAPAGVERKPVSYALTRKEREELNALSVQAYGGASKWQKLLRKGRYEVADGVTASGQARKVNRLKHFTVADVKADMEKILADRAIAAAMKAAEETAKAEAAQEGT